MGSKGIEKMRFLESDPHLIERHIKGAAWGKSKIIFLPFLLGLFGVLFSAYIYFGHLIDRIGASALIILFACSVICLLLTNLIYQNDVKALKQQIPHVKVGCAQQMNGDENSKVYSCIYAIDGKRHDETFIRNIKHRIEMLKTPVTVEEDKVLEMFSTDRLRMGEAPELIPLSFTDNVRVYLKQFSFASLNPGILQQIEDNRGLFVFSALKDMNPIFCKEFYERETNYSSQEMNMG